MAFNINVANSCKILVVRANRYVSTSTQATITVEDLTSGSGTQSFVMAYNNSNGKGTINIPIESLNAKNGVFKVCIEEGGTKFSCKPALVKCDIDCCLTKLTNELLDCACDCPKCASALAKAQKIFLLLQSSLSGVELGATASTITSAGYYNELVEKYKKAKEICDNSCGCDC